MTWCIVAGLVAALLAATRKLVFTPFYLSLAVILMEPKPTSIHLGILGITAFLGVLASPDQKISWLVDAIGAWSKTNIDNSVESLVNRAIDEPQDRDWVERMIPLVKGSSPSPQLTNTPVTKKEGELIEALKD